MSSDALLLSGDNSSAALLVGAGSVGSRLSEAGSSVLLAIGGVSKVVVLMASFS
jgi:hypothetical protein